tara:strand:+ start:7332 stop:8078 length:747 start_codon:yes stop_codon:yes gene_type:complete
MLANASHDFGNNSTAKPLIINKTSVINLMTRPVMTAEEVEELDPLLDPEQEDRYVYPWPSEWSADETTSEDDMWGPASEQEIYDYGEYEYGNDRGVWYGYVMERVYGIDMGEEPYKPPANSHVTVEYINYGLRANIKIRDQICMAGMIIMSVSAVLATFCILVSCCSGRNTRRVVNDSLKEPLLKIDELDKRVTQGMTQAASAPPLTKTSSANAQMVLVPGVANGEIVGTGRPEHSANNTASQTLSYV